MIKRLLLSGYKQYELGIFKQDHPGISIIKIALERQLRTLLEESQLEYVIISGQNGVELWAAEVVFELKMEYPQLKLAVIPAFLNQEERWKNDLKELYHLILEQADFVDYVSKKPYQSPLQFKARNKFLLDNTDGILLVYDDEKEGSPKFIKQESEKRAKAYDYELIIINSYDLQTIAEEEQEKLRSDW